MRQTLSGSHNSALVSDILAYRPPKSDLMLAVPMLHWVLVVAQSTVKSFPCFIDSQYSCNLF